MGKIKFLSADLINQIAAGELVERPSSALKEIVENSIDAGAKNIKIFIKDGGKTKIVVEDDGEGLSKEDLELCVKRHATSKVSCVNLFEVNSFGFRGEALPSIASVSDFSIASNGFEINVCFSEVSEIFPSSIKKGTIVSVENLFDKLPARLKFLKSDLDETSRCVSVIENLALSNDNINFSLNSDKKSLLLFENDTKESRIEAIFSKSLFQDAVFFEETGDYIKMHGYLFHPMDSKYSSVFQKVFVNNRIVNDKTVSQAIKNSYKDLMHYGRYPAVLVFIDILPFHVDVNVSPTKSEIRFRNQTYVRKFLTEGFKKNLKQFDRIAVDFSEPLFGIAPEHDLKKNRHVDFVLHSRENHDVFENSLVFEDNCKIFPKVSGAEIQKFFDGDFETNFEKNLDADLDKNFSTKQAAQKKTTTQEPQQQKIVDDHHHTNFFGQAVAQIFDLYIISQTKDSIMFIDMHAVHEKIVQAKLKKQLVSENHEHNQILLKPEIIEILPAKITHMKNSQNALKNLGFDIELVQNAIILSAIPSVLNPNQAVVFVKDFMESDYPEDELSIMNLIAKQTADAACHNSIRSGRQLSLEEMNELLAQMEKTETIFQCNHQRQSFVAISKHAIAKMFERT